MLSSPSGRQILRERPRISSQTVDLDYLRTLPETTFGKIYVTWLDREHVTPDTRDPVRHIPDPELAYVLQRYRESHDLFHVLLAEKGMPSFLEGEVVVKAFEFAALGLPMTGLAALSAVKLPKEQRRRVLWGGRGGAGDTYEDVGNKDGSNNSEGEEIQASRSSGGAKGGEPWITWAISQGLNTNTSPSGGLLNMYWEKEWETPILELRERLGTRLPEGVGDLRVIRRREREERKRREMAGQ
ncbi:putative ubiquinone biosynthesis protein mitochondrial precursor [Phaeomoniella chlamydospora]|uniref:Putative ubiquinone biosynthesis protein mitochondrial n=1 Tax=Phaeomoniella chlamydospora TaxID=158046 RepID=A0A0G2GBG6_PHACM|nr:putative ubiquinone biosynthesis protein mitochondrial precursor [Phaeomoniella chlamydospora]